MNLCLDIGNTRTKAAFFDDGMLKEVIIFEQLIPENRLIGLLQKNEIENAILSSVKNHPPVLEEILDKNTHFFIKLSHEMPLPIQILYATPKTLGRDRIAVVVAGHHLFPQHPVLVIDAGTCITYDFITETGNYKGGGIAPGIAMKFKALHTFTDRLPLIELNSYFPLIGCTTEESILSGVVMGTIAEMDGIIDRYRHIYPNLMVLITGGAGIFFETHVKNKIFAFPNLLLQGLHQILNYNVSKTI